MRPVPNACLWTPLRIHAGNFFPRLLLPICEMGQRGDSEKKQLQDQINHSEKDIHFRATSRAVRNPA